MERLQICIKSNAASSISGSANRLGTALAERQLEAVQGAYSRRYEQGISSFWESQIYGSYKIGQELAALKLEAQRQFVLVVGRWALMMGLPFGLLGLWAFGVVAGFSLFVASVLIGFYLGSK